MGLFNKNKTINKDKSLSWNLTNLLNQSNKPAIGLKSYPKRFTSPDNKQVITLSYTKTDSELLEIYDQKKKEYQSKKLKIPEDFRKPLDISLINLSITFDEYRAFDDKSKCETLLSIFDMFPEKINRFNINSKNALSKYSFENNDLKIFEWDEEDKYINNILSKYSSSKTPVDTKDLTDAYCHLAKNNKDCKLSVKSGLVNLSTLVSKFSDSQVIITIKTPRTKEINQIDNYVKELTGKSLVERNWDIKHSS